jgi:hypothetical protein
LKTPKARNKTRADLLLKRNKREIYETKKKKLACEMEVGLGIESTVRDEKKEKSKMRLN